MTLKVKVSFYFRLEINGLKKEKASNQEAFVSRKLSGGDLNFRPPRLWAVAKRI